MKIVIGKLVGIKEGEYQNKPQFTAQVLEQWDGGASVTEVQLAGGAYEIVNAHINEQIALSYVERVGTTNGRGWVIRYGGRVADLNEQALEFAA